MPNYFFQQLQHDWYDYSLLVLFGELMIISWGVFFFSYSFFFLQEKKQWFGFQMRLVLCAAGAYTEFSLTHRLNILDFCFLINNAAKSSSPPELALTFPACLFPKKMTFGSVLLS